MGLWVMGYAVKVRVVRVRIRFRDRVRVRVRDRDRVRVRGLRGWVPRRTSIFTCPPTCGTVKLRGLGLGVRVRG